MHSSGSTKPKLDDDAPPGECSIYGLLYSGADQTIIATTTAALPVPVVSLITQINHLPFTKYIPSDSNKLRTQVLDVSGLKAFMRYDYQVTVRGAGLDRAACQALLKDDDLSISFRPKPGAQ